MGYYTSFDIEIKPVKRKITRSCILELQKELNEISSEDIEPNEYGIIHTGFNSKWHEHEDVLIPLSAKYTNILITLYGDGEEPGDMWVKYFYQGKVQEEDVEFNYPPCKLLIK